MGGIAWGKLSLYSKAAILTVTIQAVIVAALETTIAALIIPAVDLKKIEDESAVSADLESIQVYLVLFVTSQVFAVYFLIDGVMHKNTMQLMTFVVLSACVVAYSIFQIDQLDADDDLSNIDLTTSTRAVIRSSLYAMSAISAIGTAISAFLAFKLYCEFGWRIYKKIGANPKLRNIFRTYQTLIMIMKIDLFFGVLYSVQYLLLVLKRDDYEFYLTIGGLFLTPVMLAIATYGLRQENRQIMYGFFAASLAYLVYFVFKLARMYLRPIKMEVIQGELVEVDVYKGTRKFLTFFSAITIILIVITIINAILCFRNFDQGLKKHVLSTESKRDPTTPSSGRDSLDIGDTRLHTFNSNGRGDGNEYHDGNGNYYQSASPYGFGGGGNATGPINGGKAV